MLYSEVQLSYRTCRNEILFCHAGDKLDRWLLHIRHIREQALHRNRNKPASYSSVGKLLPLSLEKNNVFCELDRFRFPFLTHIFWHPNLMSLRTSQLWFGELMINLINCKSSACLLNNFARVYFMAKNGNGIEPVIY